MSELVFAPDGPPALIGVVHLPALPGAPLYGGRLDAVLEHAVRDAQALAQGGVDAAIVENFGDTPFYPGRVPAETVAAMAIALREVSRAVPGLALGVNVLRNDAESALALCATGQASFLRVNVLNGAAVTDQGIIQGQAARLVRERQRLAPSVKILADVHVKHATSLGDETIAQAAEEAIHRSLADFVVVSGTGTGQVTEAEDLQAVAARVGRERVWIGSGLTPDNAADLLAHARGAIVGTYLKEQGRVDRPVDAERVRELRARLMKA